MNSPVCCSSNDVVSDQSQLQAVSSESPADRRSLQTTEMVYGFFALAVAVLLFATAV